MILRWRNCCLVWLINWLWDSPQRGATEVRRVRAAASGRVLLTLNLCPILSYVESSTYAPLKKKEICLPWCSPISCWLFGYSSRYRDKVENVTLRVYRLVLGRRVRLWPCGQRAGGQPLAWRAGWRRAGCPAQTLRVRTFPSVEMKTGSRSDENTNS